MCRLLFIEGKLPDIDDSLASLVERVEKKGVSSSSTTSGSASTSQARKPLDRRGVAGGGSKGQDVIDLPNFLQILVDCWHTCSVATIRRLQHLFS